MLVLECQAGMVGARQWGVGAAGGVCTGYLGLRTGALGVTRPARLSVDWGSSPWARRAQVRGSNRENPCEGLRPVGRQVFPLIC